MIYLFSELKTICPDIYGALLSAHRLDTSFSLQRQYVSSSSLLFVPYRANDN